MFYIWLSLSSHLWYWFLLSLFSHQTQLPSTEKEQNDTPIESEEKQIIFMGKATLIGSSPSSSLSEGQAARPRPLWSDHRNRHRHQRRKRHGRGHSDHRHRHRHHHSNLADLSLSRFWWLVVLIVGGWLILVDGGRLIGFWVWDLGWYWCLSLGWLGWLILVDQVLIVVFVWVFFFFCSSGWYWWSVVDLWGWPVVVSCGGWSTMWVVVEVVVVDDNGGGDNLLF